MVFIGCDDVASYGTSHSVPFYLMVPKITLSSIDIAPHRIAQALRRVRSGVVALSRDVEIEVLVDTTILRKSFHPHLSREFENSRKRQSC